jgi:hypothetical protein
VRKSRSGPGTGLTCEFSHDIALIAFGTTTVVHELIALMTFAKEVLAHDKNSGV